MNTVETPEMRKSKPFRFTRDEAAEFLAGWCRVVAPDGSTIAYTPDRVTAQQIADALRDGAR